MTTPQQQLLLGLGPEPKATLGNFVDGQNVELVHALRCFDQLAPDRRFMHLWGEPGSGRSHLLHGFAAAQGGRYASLKNRDAVPEFSPEIRAYAIDDVEWADDTQAAALFNLINQCRQHPGCAVLTSAAAAPAQLLLREDLRTRLGWGLVFLVQRLGDDDTEAALLSHARQLGLDLSVEVRRYLMTHYARDLRFLTHLLAEVDRYALASHRPVTVPLLRSFMLAQGNATDRGEPSLES